MLRPSIFSRVALLCLAAPALFGQAPTNSNRLVPVPNQGLVPPRTLRANLANSGTGSRVTPPPVSPPAQVPEQSENATNSDVVQRVRLPAGESSLQIELANIYDVNRVAFRSFTARGTVSVFGSSEPLEPGDSKWVEILPPTDFGGKATLDESFADINAQYIEFRFNTTIPGEVSPFAVTGEEFVEQSGATPPTAEEIDELSEEEKANMVPYDFVSTINGTRVSLISSGAGETANFMIDDDASTFYEFEESDQNVAMLMDLTANYRINRIAITMDAQPGRFQVYTFDVLPENLQQQQDAAVSSDTSQEVVLPDDFYDGLFPIGERVFEEPVEATDLNFDQVDARFALIRWTPPPDLPPGVEFPPLRIYEISFIGMVPDTAAAFPVIPSALFAPEPDLLPEPGAEADPPGPEPIDVETEIPAQTPTST